MTRGNQRELARAKNQKKQQEMKNKKSNDGLSLEQRKFRDAELMREKQKKKEDQKGQAQACK
ncbi:putative SERF-like protein [Anoplophora glabripennis]|uniref:putative SERF-like protein n=1 Tax=Anoplophora glabripennis TaxID=217634 RepID=UPI0008745F65|nr:putative SERF-like protein [Anoplophora glabripennis]